MGDKVTCSHDVPGESELRIPRLDLSPINAGPHTLFFFLKYPLIFLIRAVSSFSFLHNNTTTTQRLGQQWPRAPVTSPNSSMR